MPVLQLFRDNVLVDSTESALNYRHHPKLSQSRPQSLAGFTLIELLVAIGVAFIMLSTAVFTIHLVLRSERTVTRTFEYTRSITRLTRSFRSDVHAASDARLVPAGANEPNGVELILSNGSILYTVSDIGLERIESEGDQIQRRDQFRLIPSGMIKFELIGEPDRVRLIVPNRYSARTKKGDRTSVDQSVVIESTVGRHLRYQGSQ